MLILPYHSPHSFTQSLELSELCCSPSFSHPLSPGNRCFIRMGLAEYAAAISIIIFVGMPHVGELASLDEQTLQVGSRAFRPDSVSVNKLETYLLLS